MTYYPATPGSFPPVPGSNLGGNPAAPADATGVYPALAGYTPMETGRRVAVALADGAITLVAYVLMTLAVLVAGRNSGAASALTLVVSLAYLAASLWAWFGRSARLAGVVLGAQYVDVQTGLPSGGKLFGKFLLAGLLGGLTFGIAPLIMYFATVQEPLKRNWFDRTVGLMLVDLRTGRRPGDPLPAPLAAAQPPAVAPVQFPGADGVGVPAWTPTPRPAFDAGPPAPSATPVPVPAPPAAPPPWAPASAAPSPWAPVQPVVEPDGLITATPLSGALPAAQAEPPASVAPAPVVVRPMRSVDAEEADRTRLADDLDAGGPGLYLDGNTALSLTPPSVLGRNPVAPGSHPDAVPHCVDDPLASKTHLLVGRDDLGAWVIDLHSTNGVAVSREPGAPPQRIQAGRKVHLAAGAAVTFAGHGIAVR